MVNSMAFEIAIMVVILANVAVMMTDHYGESKVGLVWAPG